MQVLTLKHTAETPWIPTGDEKLKITLFLNRSTVVLRIKKYFTNVI